MINHKAYEQQVRDTAQALSGNSSAKYMHLAILIETVIAQEDIRAVQPVQIDRPALVAKIHTMARALSGSAVTELHLQLATSIEVALAIEEQRGRKVTVDRAVLAERIHERQREISGSSVALDGRLIAASLETLLEVERMRK